MSDEFGLNMDLNNSEKTESSSQDSKPQAAKKSSA